MKNLIQFEMKKSIKMKKNWFVLFVTIAILALYFVSLNRADQRQVKLEEMSLKEQIEISSHSMSTEGDEDRSFQLKELALLNEMLNAHLSLNWRMKAKAEIELLKLKLDQFSLKGENTGESLINERIEYLTILLDKDITPVYERTSVNGLHFLLNSSILLLSVLFYLLLFILVGDVYGYEYDIGTIQLLYGTPYSKQLISSAKWIVSLGISMAYMIISISLPFFIGLLANGIGTFSYPVKVGQNWSTIGVALSLVWLLVFATVLFSICLIQLLALFMRNGTFTMFLVMALFLGFRFIPETLIPQEIIRWIPLYYFQVNKLFVLGNEFFVQGIICLVGASVAMMTITFLPTFFRERKLRVA